MDVTFLNQETENRWEVVLTYKMPPHPKSVTTISPKVSTARICLPKVPQLSQTVSSASQMFELVLVYRAFWPPQTVSKNRVEEGGTAGSTQCGSHAHVCLPSKTMSMAEKHISRSSKWLHLPPGKWAPWLLRKHPRFVMLFIYIGNK